ncbi:MAG TPA: glycosyltransferase, partial [Polyangiales bacterium]|nr:glycosyltransferase [Polyangiales bacterium]
MAVRSILDQSVKDLELIIIEEPSTTRGEDFLRDLPDPRVRHYYHPTRTTLVEQRNRGIELARSELIAVLDADDIAEPDRLAKQLEFMEAHPEVGALGTQLRLIDPKGNTIGFRRYPTSPKDVTAALEIINPIGQPSVMYRKSVVQKAGMYRYPVIEDYELWCRLAANGVLLANLDEPLVRYRIHGGGIKATQLRGTLKSTIELKEQYYGSTMSAKAKLRLLGERALLKLPPQLVLWLFVRTTTSGK